ncbi:hypothetical protein NQ318_011288 [Aromia moschata]|uniref:Uncharacterized protein n=1 Tax=Aromia moschata TaxID=1265417 RepID=A0AAV8X3X2_9CUCU|nr:hypothetical protein NQ318_011288 [Aromia moschata]
MSANMKYRSEHSTSWSTEREIRGQRPRERSPLFPRGEAPRSVLHCIEPCNNKRSTSSVGGMFTMSSREDNARVTISILLAAVCKNHLLAISIEGEISERPKIRIGTLTTLLPQKLFCPLSATEMYCCFTFFFSVEPPSLEDLTFGFIASSFSLDSTGLEGASLFLLLKKSSSELTSSSELSKLFLFLSLGSGKYLGSSWGSP